MTFLARALGQISGEVRPDDGMPGAERTGPGSGAQASFAQVVILTVTLTLAAFLVLMPLALQFAHPQNAGLGAAANVANQQNQGAKTALYLVAFFVLVPAAALVVPRLADAIARGPNGPHLTSLVCLLAASLCAVLIAVRVSADLPWGDGVAVVLAAFGGWSLAAGALLFSLASGRRAKSLERIDRSSPAPAVAAALLAFGAVLCVTHIAALSVVPLVVGACVVLAQLALRNAGTRPHAGVPLRDVVHRWRAGRSGATVVDVVVIGVLLLAIPDVVIYQTSAGVPNAFFPPGVLQFQQDWILGPANQLLAGGAVMVNDPVSQYGVGMLYFLDGWFHLAPVGYGTFGLLDGLLTAVMYAAGYCCLRIAGVRAWLAACTIALAVIALVYNLHYPVGALPEQGPLRFGLPIVLVFFRLVAIRWARRWSLARTGALITVGVASVWALEAFAYTVLTYVAIAAAEAWLASSGKRRATLLWDLALGVGACVAAHVIFAIGTLVAAGQLPDWGQYFAYLNSLLLGGKEGSITYGFDRWSPGLAMGAATGASAVAVVLLVRRAREFAVRHRITVVAIAGLTGYQIAVFSYTDNRAATYLLAYVALPLFLVVALWLALLGRSGERSPALLRRSATAFACAVAVVLIAAAWPAVGDHFSDSALARAYPGGGLGGAVRRLWHSPPIDPRAAKGQQLLARYFPGRRAIVLLPTAQDLGIELLMRSGKANALFIGDPIMDDFIPGVWVPRIRRQVMALRAGQRILTQRSALGLLAILRRLPPFDPWQHETGSAIPTAVYNAPELVWTLQQIDFHFVTRVLYSNSDGLIVLTIVRRR